MEALGKHLWQGMLRAVMHSPDSWPRVASAGWMSRSGVGMAVGVGGGAWVGVVVGGGGGDTGGSGGTGV